MSRGPKRKPLKDRLESRLEPIPFSGCFVWTGATVHAGRHKHRHEYGLIGEGGGRQYGARQITTHRAAWMVYRGPIPEGMQVLHRCDVPLCCNPDHLYLGTHADNMADASRKGRMSTPAKSAASRGERNPGAKLTALAVRAMRQLRAAGWSYEDLAELFSVSYKQVYFVCTGRAWPVETVN